MSSGPGGSSGEGRGASSKRPRPSISPPIPREALYAALSAAALSVAAVVLEKSLRDALFLAIFPVEYLAPAILASGVLSAIVVVPYARWMARTSPRTTVVTLALISALAYPAIYLVGRASEKGAVIALYLWVSISGGLLVSGFWSILAERFDPRRARRLYGLVGAATAAGGLFAGVLAHGAMKRLDPEWLLLPIGLVHVVMAIAMSRLGRSSRPPSKAEPDTDFMAGLRETSSNVYLRNVALLVFTVTLAGTLADFVIKDAAATAFRDKRSLGEFFALFHGIVGAATLGIQLLIAKPLVEKRGISYALTALPAWLALAGAFMVALPSLAVAAALRGGENAIRNSFHRSGYELLFVPISQVQKRLAKPVIDNLLERLADGFAAAAVWILISVFALPATWLAWPVAIFGGVAILLVVRLQRGYVQTLSSNLLAHRVELEALADAIDDDAQAREAIRTTLVESDAQAIRDELSKSRVGKSLMMSLQLSDLPQGLKALRRDRTETKSTTVSRTRPLTDPVVDLIAALLDPDPAKVRTALSRWDGRDRRPAPTVVRLLARQEVHRDVIRTLRRNADRFVGMLADHLLDPDESFAVRRRLPRVLSSCTEPLAADALLKALADPRFEVRFHAAAGLVELQASQPDRRPPAPSVWEAIRGEVRKSRPMWEAQRILDAAGDEGEEDGLDAIQLRGAHSLRHVFQLLTLVLDPKPTELAYHALASDDEQLRGVALEYLENVLPEDVRTALWPHIGDDAAPLSRRDRPLKDVMDELNASGAILLSAVAPLSMRTGARIREAQEKGGGGEGAEQ